MQKAEISGGLVVNIIEVDPDKIPEWAASLPTVEEGVQIGWTYANGEFGPPPPPAPASVEARRADALNRLWALRRDKISGAATVNGVRLWIDLESRANLTAAVLATQLNPAMTVQWKTADGGFVVLTGAQLAALATAVMAYVQACFAREAVLKAQIEGTDPDAVDITAGWPNSEAWSL